MLRVHARDGVTLHMWFNHRTPSSGVFALPEAHSRNAAAASPQAVRWRGSLPSCWMPTAASRIWACRRMCFLKSETSQRADTSG
eukprot:48334-Chlamydomonas_euryale.AAC.3